MFKPYNAHDWFWLVAGDDTQAYSSAAAAMVPVAQVPDGLTPTRIASMDELVEVLRAAGVAPYHSVSTALIVDRLKEIGIFETASAALNANADLFARFYSRGYIYADNGEARAFLNAVGADPDQILAPAV